MALFDRKEPKLNDSLDDILSGFVTVRNKLAAFIERGYAKRDENIAKISELEEETASVLADVARAKMAEENIIKIIGEK